MSLYHNYIVLLYGIVDALLNGGPSDIPVLNLFFNSESSVSHFFVLFLNERDNKIIHALVMFVCISSPVE